MPSLKLTLRQRQLINCLRHAQGFITGAELAGQLNISSRTVRSDIAELNDLLSDRHVRVVSKHRFGYHLEAEEENSLNELTQAAESYLTRTERLRHLVLRLSLSDDASDLDELSDEMYISRATLENDLKAFRKEYLLKFPFIRLIRFKNRICFENDERKRRIMLCQLYADSWDYTAYGNTFYQYEYLEEDTVRCCMEELQKCMHKYQIQFEDTNVVHLNLMLAIAVRRMSDGYVLTDHKKNLFISEEARPAVNALADSLERHFSCIFTEIEREDILEMFSCSRLPDMNRIRQKGVQKCFVPDLITFTDSFLDAIRQNYQLDFRGDEDFYLTLLIYFRYLGLPIHYLNETGLLEHQVLRKYSIEMELAFAVEPFALKYYGNYLDFQELLYLSFLFSGALVRMPFPKIRTVILSQHNEPAVWNLRMQIEDHFSYYLEITDLLPLYGRNPAATKDTDLIIQTIKKSLSETDSEKTLSISPWFDRHDRDAIEDRIRHIRFARLYGRRFPSITALMEQAEWFENLETDDFFELLLTMGRHLIGQGYVDEDYLTDLLHRHSLISFAVQPSFILVHSSVPAEKTHIAVATLRHRLRVNGQKIRTVILYCMTKEDIGLTFKLGNDLYHEISDPEETMQLKTKSDWLRYLKSRQIFTFGQ